MELYSFSTAREKIFLPAHLAFFLFSFPFQVVRIVALNILAARVHRRPVGLCVIWIGRVMSMANLKRSTAIIHLLQ